MNKILKNLIKKKLKKIKNKTELKKNIKNETELKKNIKNKTEKNF